jgi:hypothetical protein
MHKTGACLQMLGLRGDPRWQSRELAPGLPRGQLLAQGCNALNLGVEFFLLFTHQIQALLPFLFLFRSFLPISKQYSDWCKQKPKLTLVLHHAESYFFV